MSETVIKIENLKKRYRLGTIGGGTLTADLQSWWARVRGKEDPNTMVGTDISSKNKTFMALKGIDLEINKGDTIGIIGGNGAGKSTLLKILSRVTAPTEGNVKINGRISSMLEVGTGFHGELTGRENIYLNGAILGMTNAEVDEKIDAIIDFSECREFIDTPVKRYSSGMYVKLAFSVASHLDSEILIMDEATSNLDSITEWAIERTIEDCTKNVTSIIIAHRLRTILYVSHNMKTIEQLCNRVVVLEKGTVRYDGEVDEGISIYLNSKVSQSYVNNDLSIIKRDDYIPKIQKARLNNLTILDKDVPIFYDDEKFKCRLTWKNYDDIEDVQLRFEVRAIDDTPIAASVCKSKLYCKKDIDTEFDVEFDIRRLVSGKYQLLIVLCEIGELGGYRDIDCVYPACTFEVSHDKFNSYNFEWNKKQWGYIQLDNLELKELIKLK